MAKKTAALQSGVKRTITTEETILDDGDTSVPTPSPTPEPAPTPEQFIGMLPAQEPEEITALLEELGDEDHKVVVYRFDENLKAFARLDSYSHKEFSLDSLADSYGGGRYRIHVFRPNGQIAAGVKIINIDKAKKPKVDSSTVHTSASGTQVFMPPQQDMTKVMDIMMTQSNRQQELMMTMMTKMAEVMSGSHQAPAAPSIFKDVGDIVALQKLFESKGDPQINNMNAVLGALQKGMELAQAANPSGNSESGGGGLLDTVIKALLPAVTGNPGLVGTVMSAMAPLARPQQRAYVPQQNPIQNPPPFSQVPAAQSITGQPQLSAPIPVVAEPVVETPKEQGMNLGLQLVIAMYRGPIVDMAKDGFETDKAAEIIVLRIPETYYAMVLDFTNKADRLELVKQFIPELFIIDSKTQKDFSEWTTKVLDAGKVILTEYFGPEIPAALPAEVIEVAPELKPDLPAVKEPTEAK